MREEESRWFTRWEEELPTPEELTPLSQTLITRDLAVAFDIQTPASFNAQQQQFRAPGPSSGELDSSSSEPARTLKRPRLVWTPQLHKRFVDAVAHLGIKNAVPKTIMQLMSVDGLTRENVASHLQKYRLYLKRMQGGLATAPAPGDAATDRLFATSPVPPHLLGGGAASGGMMGYVSPPVGLHHHHHLQNRQMGHSAQFDHPFLARQSHVAGRFGGGGAVALQSSGHGFVEDVDLGAPANPRNVLTLFPAAQD